MTVPVALFAFVRTDVLARTLGALRDNGVRLIHAFSDGPRRPDQAPAVEAVRAMLRAIDWAEVRLTERPENLGLGRSIRAGVAQVLAEHERVIVFEDDLVCAPGTYDYLCAALERYRDETRVLSVTAYTHPRVVPRGVRAPYFDGRAECLVWGTWRRAWDGMEKDAMTLLRDAQARGLDPGRYGDDLVEMARAEQARNIWAVRWSYLHLAQRGLCLRPPVNLVAHIGLDALATNAANDHRWAAPVATAAPAAPIAWPAPEEHPDCARLWRRACGARGLLLARIEGAVGALLRRRR